MFGGQGGWYPKRGIASAADLTRWRKLRRFLRRPTSQIVHPKPHQGHDSLEMPRSPTVSYGCPRRLEVPWAASELAPALVQHRGRAPAGSAGHGASFSCTPPEAMRKSGNTVKGAPNIEPAPAATCGRPCSSSLESERYSAAGRGLLVNRVAFELVHLWMSQIAASSSS